MINRIGSQPFQPDGSPLPGADHPPVHPGWLHNQPGHRLLEEHPGAAAEPGLAAGRASLAYVEGGYGHFGSGFGVAATLLRTWKDPLTAKPNMSYVGGEVLLWPIVFIGPRVGLFHTVSGNETNKRWFVSLDLGIAL